LARGKRGGANRKRRRGVLKDVVSEYGSSFSSGLPDHKHTATGDGGNTLKPNTIVFTGAAPARSIDLTSFSTSSPYLDQFGNLHFPSATVGVNYQVLDKNAVVVGELFADGTKVVKTANQTLDDGSGNLTALGVVQDNKDPQSVYSAGTYTTSTVAFTSSGFGKAKVSRTGRVLVTITGTITTAVASIYMGLQGYHNTAGIPVAGTAVGTDTADGGQVTGMPTTTTQRIPFALTYIVTGLTIGTTYYFYLAALSQTATDAVTVSVTSFTANDI